VKSWHRSLARGTPEIFFLVSRHRPRPICVAPQLVLLTIALVEALAGLDSIERDIVR
jgi:hypothetical protein